MLETQEAITRTDIHRPSAINPADYEFVGFEHMKIDDISDCQIVLHYRNLIKTHMVRTGGDYSRHQHGGNCHICGAAAVYTVLFYHKPTNTYIRTGQECAEKLDCGDMDDFRRQVKQALEARAGVRKAEAVLSSINLSAAWAIYQAYKRDRTDMWQRREEPIIFDMVGNLIRYGSLSEKQSAFLAKLTDAVRRRPEIEAQRKAEAAAAQPVPVSEERMTVRGKILSIRVPDRRECGYEVLPTRMLVQHESGWKVWGTLPSSLDANVGDTVEFCASVKVSEKDEKFGFFSRPTKAKTLEAAHV